MRYFNFVDTTKNISNLIQSSKHPNMYPTFATQAHETNGDLRGRGGR
jgi:hypothetical protein